MPNAKPKIFVFINSGSASGFSAVALTEDGEHVAGHFSSTLGFARRDMGLTDYCDWQHDKYAAKYPDGYELVDVVGEPGTVEKHVECMLAIHKANMRAALTPATEAVS